MSTRYFTFRTGSFTDGVKALVFTGSRSCFLLPDGTERPQSMWSLEEAITNTETGKWIEISEDDAYGRKHAIQTAAPNPEGSW